MDPALVRGKKSKGDSDSKETSNQYDEEYPSQPVLTALPPLTPIIKRKSPEGSQESLLKFRAEALKYQGMCLHYQASLLEKQARSIQKANQYQDLKYNNKMVNREQKYFHNILHPESKYAPSIYTKKNVPNLTTTEYISKKAGYESKYRPSLVDYPAKANSPIYYSDIEDRKLPNSAISKPKSQGSMYGHPRNEMSMAYNERDRSPLRMPSDAYQKIPSYGHHLCPTRDMHSRLSTPERRHYTLTTKPERQLYQPEPETPLLPSEDGSCSPGPMDLSVRTQNSQSPQLHTQALNMPRIFF